MAQQGDAKAYYGYLFRTDKKPTKVLDALLRGIANYIITSIGDKDVHSLTPTKLAAFFKAVGGNYDSLFVEVPHPSLSYIYQSLSCQHSLQPTIGNDSLPPSIPALTVRGYVRWQCIQILLGPEENVPYIQTAVRDFGIKHPDTGDPFPVDIPKAAFPLHSDPTMEKWFYGCAEKLRIASTPDEDDSPSARPSLPPRPPSGYTHLRVPYSPGQIPRERKGGVDYFTSKSRQRYHKPQTVDDQQAYLSPGRDERGRRRSVPENYYSPSPTVSAAPAEVRPNANTPEEDHTRRHSHPRHRRTPSTTSSSPSAGESDTSSRPPSPMDRRKSKSKPKRPSIHIHNPRPVTPPRTRHRGATLPISPRDQRQNTIDLNANWNGNASAANAQWGIRDHPLQLPRSTPRQPSLRWRDLLDIPLARRRESQLRKSDDWVKMRSGSNDGPIQEWGRDVDEAGDNVGRGVQRRYTSTMRNRDGRRFVDEGVSMRR